ncbi:hypothetical protein ACFCWY_02785 [Streptomyces sp. NPDC056362]|uniref:hypothetical protein n=1 Tax=unclassified Streptomyces TaxID=2593676 RepID=UPI0035E14E54
MDTKTTEKTATAKNDEAAERATAETAETTPEAGTVPADARAEAAAAPDAKLDAETAETPQTAETSETAEDDDLEDLEADAEAGRTATATGTGIGAGAAAVVSAALAAVALTGTWTGKVVSERETLIGQIKTSNGGSPAQQISEIYGDAWHSTALVNGVFALLALIVGVLVLTLPRRAPWVRSVAVAGAVLGGLGLLLSAGTYFDLFLSLPSTGS